QRPEGVGREVCGTPSERRRPRSVELQVRPRRADLRFNRQHHLVQPHAVLRAARHRREQARRLDQDSRPDLRAHAVASRRAAGGSGREALRTAAARRGEAPRADARTAARPRRRGAPARGRPKAARGDERRLRDVSGRRSGAAGLLGGAARGRHRPAADQRREPAVGTQGRALVEDLLSKGDSPMTPETLPEVRDYDDIEAEVKAFEEAERRRLNLNDEPIAHWVDPNPQRFTRAERGHTTILFGGLTIAHDQMVSAALTGLGHKVQPLDVADTEALRFGKEFGNRGQCNPTYFTVGNLVKYLVHLRDREHVPVEEIVRSHLFFTAGACG